MFIADSNKCISEETHFTKYVAGAEVNVAIGLKRLGYDVTFISAVGDDPFGTCIIKFLKDNEISTEFIEVQKNRTGFLLKNRETDGRDAQVVYFRDFTPATMIKKELIEAIDFSKYDMLHLTGIFSLLSSTNFEIALMLIEKAKEANIPISFDPNCRINLWKGLVETNIEKMNTLISRCDIFIPGSCEILFLSNKENLEDAIDYYKNIVPTLIVKDGSSCSRYITKEKDIKVDCFKVDVVDTVGAGDGFAVGVISAYLENKKAEDILIRANAIGGIQVSNIGDNEGLPTREELEKFIQNHK